MNKLTRRSATFGLPIGLSIPAIKTLAAKVDPDARLIQLAKEHAAAWKACDDVPGHIDLEDGVPEWDHYMAIREKVLSIAPQTLAGLRAKAEVLKVEDPNNNSFAYLILDDVIRVGRGAV